MNEGSNKSVAIVGVSCRFPEASNLNEFWNILEQKKSIVKEVPQERWEMSQYYDPDKKAPGKTNQNKGAFLSDVNKFDPLFFNISPKEAIEMSPSQKLIMELAWEAIESSNLPYNKVIGTRSGVYIGNIWSDFEHYRKDKNAEINLFTGIGSSANVIANRISYFMGLTGPSFVLDTGCSSSLIAIMEAVNAIRYENLEYCLAGGINHILDPDQYVNLAKFGGLSSKGKCSSFDADADGFVRAEGAGLVLLKSLEKAERDGDKIIAVIRGGATNNNGFNDNMPATSPKGQYDLLDMAYSDANIDPEKVNYIEAHGTGTKLGDPVELNTLNQFFHKKEDKLIVGSVKTNVGHCEAAAGIAGLVKVLACMQNKNIPVNLNFNKPNPKIDFSHIKVLSENAEWPVDEKQNFIAGVSSYGWGGANAHLVLEEYKTTAKKKSNIEESYCLTLSARSEEALKEYASNYSELLSNNIINAAHICAATAINKPAFEYKKLFTATSAENLIQDLNEFVKEEEPFIENSDKNHNNIVFIFPGQGSQWLGMGTSLYKSEPVFRSEIDACEAAFESYVNWSLTEELFASKANSNLNKIDVIQPCIFAMQIALAKLWISKGLIPTSVVGHSMGEVAAAYIGGALTINDAANVICTRSQLMYTLSNTGGAMAVTELEKSEAEKIVAQYDGKLSVAVENSPTSTVIAGDEISLKTVIQELEKRDLFAKQVKVDVASHSPQMDAIKEELQKAVQDVSPLKTQYNIYSTVRNKKLQGTEMTNAYWVENLRNKVQFVSVMEQLMNDNHTLYVEVSPHPVLKNAISDCLRSYKDCPENTSVIGTLHRERTETEEFYANFAAIFEKGYKINWNEHFNVHTPLHINLPYYPMQREEYAIKDRSNLISGNAKTETNRLLGQKLNIAHSDKNYWTTSINMDTMPQLLQHKVGGNAVLPAAFYIDMLLDAINEIEPNRHNAVKNIAFHSAVTVDENSGQELQLTLNKTDENIDFVFSIKNEEQWIDCCTGIIGAGELFTDPDFQISDNFEVTAQEDIYSGFEKLGVHFGQTFQNVTSINTGDTFALSNIELGNKLDLPISNKLLRASLIDAVLHPVFGSLFNTYDGSTQINTFVTGVGTFRYLPNTSLCNKFKVVTTRNTLINSNKKAHSIKEDVYVFNYNDELIYELLGVEAKCIDTGIKVESDSSGAGSSVTDALQNITEEQERVAFITEFIRKTIAREIKAKATTIKDTTVFKNLGIDSLTMVQLRAMFDNSFSIKLGNKDMLKHPTCAQLATHINGMINCGEGVNEPSPYAKIISNKDNYKNTLFLIHDAGGSASLFDGWESKFKASCRLITIELPAHGDRSKENPITLFCELMNELLPEVDSLIDGKFSLYGHSMGGLIAFELCRQLQYKHKKTAEHLFVSGTPCLKGFTNYFVNNLIENKASNEEIAALLPNLKDVDINTPVIQELIQTIRNDFELIYSYEYKDGKKLDCDITAIHGNKDDRVNMADVQKWHMETNGKFELESVIGEHDFVYHNQDVLTYLIQKQLFADTVAKSKTMSKAS